MKRPFALATAMVGIGLTAGVAGVFSLHSPAKPVAVPSAWSETAWPFAMDQWGVGKAFVCAPANCGTRVELYVRPKIGFCNCSTGVADDTELERVADTELVTPRALAQAAGRPIKVGWMVGLSRPYRVADDESNAGLLSIAFNDECDALVALATTGDAEPSVVEPTILAFLNSMPTVLWIKKELGLEFVRRDW
jgi:hypothetical protein